MNIWTMLILIFHAKMGGVFFALCEVFRSLDIEYILSHNTYHLCMYNLLYISNYPFVCLSIHFSLSLFYSLSLSLSLFHSLSLSLSLLKRVNFQFILQNLLEIPRFKITRIYLVFKQNKHSTKARKYFLCQKALILA